MKKLCLKNATSMLSRKEMKAIIGGYDGGGYGSCCARQFRNYAPPGQGQYAVVSCGFTQAQAQAFASGGAGGGNYCCTDCGTASWCC